MRDFSRRVVSWSAWVRRALEWESLASEAGGGGGWLPGEIGGGGCLLLMLIADDDGGLLADDCWREAKGDDVMFTLGSNGGGREGRMSNE